MRFEPEIDYHDNTGLALAREILLPVQRAHPSISISDVWVLAGYEAVEALGGPRIEMAWGRVDATADQAPEICPPAERFPDWSDGLATVREKFGRMGFGDRSERSSTCPQHLSQWCRPGWRSLLGGRARALPR